MTMYQHTDAQSEATLWPVTTSGDAAWRSGLLQSFAAIDLSEMRRVELLRRVETKYLMSEEQLCQALVNLPEHYRILEIDGRRLHRYQTLYFDTQDLALYHQHHNGWRSRYKVRGRVYADTDLAFLEVKHKIEPNAMIKTRVRTEELSPEIGQTGESFLRDHYPYRVGRLEAALFNSFRRMTLVSRHSVERLTVDVDVRIWRNGVQASLDGLAIAELKQESFSTDSEFVRQMRALGVRPTGFSKYCIGISMLYPQVKHNNFKPKLRQISKLTGGSDYVQ